MRNKCSQQVAVILYSERSSHLEVQEGEVQQEEDQRCGAGVSQLAQTGLLARVAQDGGEEDAHGGQNQQGGVHLRGDRSEVLGLLDQSAEEERAAQHQEHVRQNASQ